MKKINFILLIILFISSKIISQEFNQLDLTQDNSLNSSWCSYSDKYALIIMGGNQAPSTNLYGWYWGDCFRMYNKLINNFSFSPSNIRLLSYGDSATVHSGEVYNISSISNVVQSYQWLAQTSTNDDLCYIFWVDHGSPTDFLLNDGNISHTTLGTLTKSINARCIAGAYNPCNSGAIVDDVSASNVITVTSVLPTELNSYGWAGAWTTGITGGGTNDPSDFNGDGHVTFTEMFDWIAPKSLSYGEHTTYDDNGDGSYSILSSSNYNPNLLNYDGNFGKNYSLSGWNCNTTNLNEKDLSIQIFPNPTKDIIVFSFKGNNQVKCQLAIYDNLGKRVHETDCINNDKIEIDVRVFKNGIYHYMFSSPTKNLNSTGKFIKY
jgi:hypothetical protein